MSESSLSVSYNQLRQEIGDYLGFGRTVSKWDAAQATKVESILISGLRQFYFPVPVRGRELSSNGSILTHRWSFLFDDGSITTEADTSAYVLPDNYGGLEGEYLTYDPATYTKHIEVTSDVRIRQMNQYNNNTGKPVYAAIVAASKTTGKGSRWNIILYPTPDAAYNLYYKYRLFVNALSSSNPYPYGGASHSETIIESCLAIAEQRKIGVAGLHTERFRDLLMMSIADDCHNGTPRVLGINQNGETPPTFERVTGITFVEG